MAFYEVSKPFMLNIWTRVYPLSSLQVAKFFVSLYYILACNYDA